MVDLKELKTDMCVIQNKLNEIGNLSLNDFDNDNGGENLLEAVFDMNENIKEAFWAIESLMEGQEND